MRKALIAGIILLAALLTEGALRIYGFGRAIRYHPHPNLGWEMVPGQNAFNVRGRARVRVNSLGFRGDEILASKPTNGLRLLFLGDAVAIGPQVPEGETFPFRVETFLQEHHPERTVETVSGGAAGYHLDQKQELLYRKGLALQPDWVVVAFAWDDWTPSRMRGPGVGPDPFHEYTGRDAWRRRLAVHDFAFRLRRLLKRRQLRKDPKERLPASANEAQVWAHVEASLDSIVVGTRSVGGHTALFVLPSEIVDFAPEEYARRESLLATWARSRDVVYISPQFTDGAEDARRSTNFLDMWHFSSEGHRYVAALLGPVINNATED